MQYRTKRQMENDSRDAGCIEEWKRKELDALARAEFDAVLRTLRVIPARDWDRPDYGILTGSKKYSGIGEIRFFAGKQYRPLGFFLDGEVVETFVLLIGAYKKGPKWTPDQAREEAGRRRENVINDRSYIGEYSF